MKFSPFFQEVALRPRDKIADVGLPWQSVEQQTNSNCSELGSLIVKVVTHAAEAITACEVGERTEGVVQ